MRSSTSLVSLLMITVSVGGESARLEGSSVARFRVCYDSDLNRFKSGTLLDLAYCYNY